MPFCEVPMAVMVPVTPTPMTTNTSTVAFEASGQTGICAAGTFGGGTMVLEVSPDGGTTWIPLAGASYTAAFTTVITMASGARLRAVLTGATTPSISVWRSEATSN